MQPKNFGHLVGACVVALSMFAAPPAQAYLDPGTGSLLLQALIGGMAALAAGIGVYWSKLKSLLARFKGDKQGD